MEGAEVIDVDVAPVTALRAVGTDHLELDRVADVELPRSRRDVDHLPCGELDAPVVLPGDAGLVREIEGLEEERVPLRHVLDPDVEVGLLGGRVTWILEHGRDGGPDVDLAVRADIPGSHNRLLNERVRDVARRRPVDTGAVIAELGDLQDVGRLGVRLRLGAGRRDADDGRLVASARGPDDVRPVERLRTAQSEVLEPAAERPGLESAVREVRDDDARHQAENEHRKYLGQHHTLDRHLGLLFVHSGGGAPF